MTTLFIRPGKYVAGIFQDDADAAKYLSTMPEGRWEVMRVSNTYPFVLIERKGPDGAEFSIADPDQLRCGPGGTLYEINTDYVPPQPWTDWMGALPHVHADIDADDEHC